MSLISRVGSFLYRSVEFLSMNVSATHKVTMTLDYRRRWHEFLSHDQLQLVKETNQPALWIHGASVGELEDLAAFYGNPELLKKAGYSSSQLVITSSSPSAEEFLLKLKTKINPRYAGPLPPDVLPRLEEFFEKLKPELLILVQSDVWPVAMTLAQKRLSKGAIWLPHKDSSASWSRKTFLGPLVKRVGLRRTENINPLPEIKSNFIGSPRVDRILERIDASPKEHPLKDHLSSAKGKIKILIGSAWKEEARIMREALESLREEDQKCFEIFTIPHDTRNSGEISSISAYLGKNIILLEGILLESYKDFDLAFVGGAFRTGLHNIIEPLAWGVPTFCGPDLNKQPEAPYFVSQGALKSITSANELKQILLLFIQNKEQENATLNEWKNKLLEAKELFKSQRGASARLADLIHEIRQ